MSDLQCPATFHVAGPQVPVHGPASWTEVPVAAAFVGAGRHSAQVSAQDGPTEQIPAARALWDVLEELADEYRGRHVLVLPAEVSAPLTGPQDAVVVRIDADGASVGR